MLKIFASFLLVSVVTSLFLGPKAIAYDPNDVTDQLNKTPKELYEVNIKEHLGDQVDMSLAFEDDSGHEVTLGSFFDNNRPVVMTMVYYNCPSLCNFHLNGLTETFKKMNWTAGKDFRLVAVSMDHRETHKVAGPKKANYIKDYGRPEGAKGWHFLTGSEANVKKLADQLGFGFKWLPEKKEFAHASAAFILTPGGQISRYLHGISFLPKTMKLALYEASKGKIGSIVEQVLMYCFRFDPKKNKYTIYAYNVMRIGGTATLLLLAIFLVPYWLREKRKNKV